MEIFNTNILMTAFSGLALTLALGLFLLVLWLNPRRQLNVYFALFLFMVVLWTAGAVLGHTIALMGGDSALIGTGVKLIQAGFVGASASLYPFVVSLGRSQGRFFTRLSFAGMGIIVIYQLVLLLVRDATPYMVNEQGLLNYSFNPFSIILFFLFDGTTILLLWFQRRRIRERIIPLSVGMFVVAQLISLLNPRLRNFSVPVLLGDMSVLLISLALTQQQVIGPLVGRATQLETVRDVGLTIASRLRLQEVLSAIAGQATALLQADGAAIFLLREQHLELAAVNNMPEGFIGYRLAVGQGVVGKVAESGVPVRIDDYARDWDGEPDLPLAQSTFGSVVGVPLIFGEIIQGILLVVQGKQSSIFGEEDVRLLELLGPQAAVAIANGQLFEQQNNLTNALAAAKDQLETVLTSTQNPVIAVDRSLRVLFANPAAVSLVVAVLGGDHEVPAPRTVLEGRKLLEVFSGAEVDFLPQNVRAFLRSLRKRRVFVYELELAERVYMCHVAALGAPRAIGWVAVLNDITELKELDRFKSQMVRMTSHDLKNPLFAAMSYVELLQDELTGGDTQLQGYAEIIFQQLERMNRTISSILNLERVQTGMSNRETIALDSLLAAALVEIERQAESQGLIVSSNISADIPTVVGDYRYIFSAIVNILENAIKFTPRGGQVLLMAQPSEGGALITVKDTGVGIPKELHGRVFERFFRAQQPGTEHVSGSGLGLSLVRAVVRAHKGRVWLESEPGQGTIVYIWLPSSGNSHPT